MAFGEDTVVDNHPGIQSDSWRPTHEEELPPHHSLHDALREGMKAERRNPRSRDEYLRYHTLKKDKMAGRENPGYLPSMEEVAGQGIKVTHTTKAAWAVEFADAPKYFNGISSRGIAIDAGNHPHTAYGGDHLYYAYHDGASWHYEIADASVAVGWNAAIALDTSGHAHISYNDERNSDLKYATNKSGHWVTEAVATEGYVGWYTSLSLDAWDKAHISHYDIFKEDLKYTTNSSGRWVTTTVDSRGNAGHDSSIGVDASGRAHISYGNRTLADLLYATGIPPSAAITSPATRITKTSATLNATINANRLPTQAWFEWGPLSGVSNTYASPKKIFSGTINQKYSYKMRELNQKWPYYFYRVVAENEDGIFYGEEMSFETKR